MTQNKAVGNNAGTLNGIEIHVLLNVVDSISDHSCKNLILENTVLSGFLDRMNVRGNLLVLAQKGMIEFSGQYRWISMTKAGCDFILNSIPESLVAPTFSGSFLSIISDIKSQIGVENESAKPTMINPAFVELIDSAKGVTKFEIAKQLDASNSMFNYSAESGATSYRNYSRRDLLETCFRFGVKPISQYHKNRSAK